MSPVSSREFCLYVSVLHFLVILLAVVQSTFPGTCLAGSDRANETTKPIDLAAGQRQLFLEDFLVAEMAGLKRTLHQPVDYEDNPVMLPEHSWEHRRIPFGSVFYSPTEKKFRCWYLTLNIYDSRPGFRGYRKKHHVPLDEAAFICYAESEDGIHWRKPNLGLHEFRGSKQNNIVLTCPGSHFDSTSVMHTPHDERRPWKMISFIGRWPYKEDLIKREWGEDFTFGVDRAAHYAWSSKDGIHWTPMNGGEHVLRATDRSMFWWDTEQKIYAGAAKSSHENKRAQRYAWSRDCVNWTITPTWINVADERDHPGDEAEAAYGFNYGAQYVGVCEMRRIRKAQPVKINWELMVSRDGRHWNRPFRELFLADGPKESWRYQVFKIFANPPIERDGQLWIYYGGKTGLNDAYTGTGPNQALCLARVRKDGFVSLDGGADGGKMITKPVFLQDEVLHINADAGSGEIRVAVQNIDGTTVEGFAESACQPIETDTLDSIVSWANGRSLKELRGRPVQLVIRIQNAKLFSFWTEEGSNKERDDP